MREHIIRPYWTKDVTEVFSVGLILLSSNQLKAISRESDVRKAGLHEIAQFLAPRNI